MAVKKSSQTAIKAEVTVVKEVATEKIRSLDKLSKAGQDADRGGLTKASRAVDKHGNRPDTIYPKATGNQASKNMQGQSQLDSILTHSETDSTPNKFGWLDYRIPDGRGACYNADGSFRGFLES